ncbi:hypothetical protein PENSPDRAFT_747738 [Peniophora sp. CONT]|nr:hypothetical protein PENSPDRAFT_747738 [Peniophora sp. CONT]
MPQRPSRPGALQRTHSHTRTASSNGSKVGLNLHFTKQDAPSVTTTTTKSDRSKRSSVGQHSATRVQSTLGRTSSTARIASRENLTALAPRVPPPARTRQTSGHSAMGNGKHKAGFTLASRDGSGSDDDDDSDGEWISSESGATTPNKHAPASPPPQQQHPKLDQLRLDPSDMSAGPATSPPVETPRGETTTPPAAKMNGNTAEQQRPKPVPTITTQPPSAPRVQPAPRTPSPPPVHARTEPTTPTTPEPPRHHHRSKRHSHTRPPSIISDHGGPLLRPHPLIRGNSHGLGAVAPLTISSTAVQAQLATPPPTTPTTNNNTPSTHGKPVQFRRTSSASARSVATLPARNSVSSITPTPTSTSGSPFAGRGHDRTRTLSAVSASSAALSSLAQLPSRGHARQQLTQPQAVRFPPAPQPGTGGVHALLPAPYVQTHATVLAWRAPVRESFERVAWARARAGRA